MIARSSQLRNVRHTNRPYAVLWRSGVRYEAGTTVNWSVLPASFPAGVRAIVESLLEFDVGLRATVVQARDALQSSLTAAEVRSSIAE